LQLGRRPQPAGVFPSAVAHPLRPRRVDDRGGGPLAGGRVAGGGPPHGIDTPCDRKTAPKGRSALLPSGRFRGSEALSLVAFQPEDARVEGGDMLRTVSAVEQRPWLLLASVFFGTMFFAFIVNAAGNV